jgi:hypothetical protein
MLILGLTIAMICMDPFPSLSSTRSSLVTRAMTWLVLPVKVLSRIAVIFVTALSSGVIVSSPFGFKLYTESIIGGENSFG